MFSIMITIARCQSSATHFTKFQRILNYNNTYCTVENYFNTVRITHVNNNQLIFHRWLLL